LYRRPFELAKVRYTACMEHREDAKRIHGPTKAQLDALELGREKGTNHLEGIPKSAESNEKRSASLVVWCNENPDAVEHRSSKISGELHYAWSDGCSTLNKSIRQMTKNRKWIDQVKTRDGKCLKCGSNSLLEAHHVVPLAEILELHNISSVDGAKDCDELWNIINGMTLCRECHYKEHNRKYDNRRKDI